MKNSYKTLTAFAVGAAAGAVLGILFAPGKGVETRAKLSLKRKEAIDEAKELIGKGKEKYSHLKNEFVPSKREKAEELS